MFFPLFFETQETSCCTVNYKYRKGNIIIDKHNTLISFKHGIYGGYRHALCTLHVCTLGGRDVPNKLLGFFIVIFYEHLTSYVGWNPLPPGSIPSETGSEAQSIGSM